MISIRFVLLLPSALSMPSQTASASAAIGLGKSLFSLIGTSRQPRLCLCTDDDDPVVSPAHVNDTIIESGRIQAHHDVAGSDASVVDTCPDGYWNEELNVRNVIEIDVDPDAVRAIWHDYVSDLRPYRSAGGSTDDFCLVSPYEEGTETWSGEDEDGVVPDGTVRSDIRWYSVRNERTYRKYMRHVDRLGVRDVFRGTWIDSDEVTVYAMFFIPRSRSDEYHFHVDWDDRVHTQVMNVLVPLNQFDINLMYKDSDDNEREYKYQVGKAIGFSGGFVHSTGLGHSEEEDVLFCIYLGSDDPKIWEYAKHNIADELEYYMNPITRRFVRNEDYPDSEICQ